MDEQSRLPGVPQAGLLQETTFNILLADALRRKRKAWRDQPETVIAERTRVVEGGERGCGACGRDARLTQPPAAVALGGVLARQAYRRDKRLEGSAASSTRADA